jgi:phosphoglycerol transferase MdoB-like AlkP superfamily enzyme
MVKYAADITKVFLYYLLLFAVCRLIFLIYFTSAILSEGVSVIPRSLVAALPLDISAASYLMFVPLMLLFAGSIVAKRFFTLLLRAYLLFTSVICILLSIAEIGVYQEVHIKPYFNLLTHLAHIDELFHSTSFSLIFLVLGVSGVLIYACSLVLSRLFTVNKQNEGNKWSAVAGFSLITAVTAGILIIGCRGGLQPIPINEGEVYFSGNQCVNDATVNPLWNMVHSYIENRKVLHGNAYKVMDDSAAEKIVADLYNVEKDTTIQLINCAKPNICIVILESWSADIVASLGGYEGLTPNFEKLVSEGYLFTNIKPAGHVSDQGVPAILSGYPALPIGSAINQSEKQINLDCINNELVKNRYVSKFFFGGQLIYGNIKSYIYRNKFTQVIEQQDLPAALPAGRLGINDSVMFEILLDSINTMSPPFFTSLFTLSTHSPFDAGRDESVTWGGAENPYLNSVVYADRQIGRFFDAAKKQPWYKNTVFILVADHSHNTPKNYSYCSPEFYHIPLLICGGALKQEYRGVKNSDIGSQMDIASTLLHQLQLPNAPDYARNYRWSKNLLNPYTSPFAFYTFDEGFGFVQGSNTVIWNKKFPALNINTATDPATKDSAYKKGAAVLQVLMNDFLSR